MADPARSKRNTKKPAPAPAPKAAIAAPAAAVDEESPLERKMNQLLLRWVPIGTFAIAVGAFFVFDMAMSILILAGGALLGVIAIFWESLRTLAGEGQISIEEAIALGSPTSAIEQKRSILQALKDLEYERGVGKVADADYEMLKRRYRAEAKRLLREMDKDLEPMRKKAAAYVDAQLRGGPRPKPATDEPDQAAGEPEGPPLPKCAACGTGNDEDASFCKKCGAKLGAAGDDARETVEKTDATA